MSSEVVCFKVMGRPSAWARARMARGRFFKSHEQVQAQKHIAIAGGKAANGIFFEGPVELTCKFFFKRPLKGKEETLWFVARPDGDNLIKQVKDSLNGIVWKDDAQVVRGLYEKQYSDEEEHSWIEIRAL